MDYHKRKLKIGIAIPAPQQVSPDFSLSNFPMILQHTKKVLPNVELVIKHQTGVRTDKNRNIMVKELLEEYKVDFILHLDADEVYPPDIIERYLEADDRDKVDVIGAYYFKRAFPYSPVGYILNEGEDKKTKPYRTMLPQFVKRGVIYECDGLGFGGMFVARHVYDKLGDRKWCSYGKNFHLPFDTEEGLTHDLEFCRWVKEAGMSVRLHGSIRPGHIGEILVTENDYYSNVQDCLKAIPDILVIMPHINETQAKQTARLMQNRAGVKHRMLLVEDLNRHGFVKTINDAARKNKADLYVYTAQDVFVGRDWLLNALKEQVKRVANVTAFNDGKWNGRMPQFGMVTRSFCEKVYNGGIFCEEYNCNYCDVEIGQIAKDDGSYAFAKDAIMIEVDYVKDFGLKPVNKQDKETYAKRAKTGFGGLVTNEDLLKEFS